MAEQRGGVNNEIGSVHRRGIAVFLATYGLAGEGVLGGDFVPVRLAFETGQATDDLCCVSEAGTRMFISAKHICGNDEQNFGATVKQWVKQAPALGPDDLLVLATAELRGALKMLPAALDRRRHAPDTPAPGSEQKALAALKKKIDACTDDPVVRERVIEAAHVLVANVVKAGDVDFDLGVALLQGSVVAKGHGRAAVQALAEDFHTQASTAFASGLDDWVKVLRATPIEVFADGEGAAGAAANARQLALSAYRDWLGAEDGRVSLSLLAGDLPELTVADLADGLRVTVEGGGRRRERVSLLAMSRRWPRLLLAGLPGMGKSTALRQLAARWAKRPTAALPVPVSLPVVADRCGRAADVTLGVLCEVAAQYAPVEHRKVLMASLERACHAGHAVLLLDGFDECGARRSWIADGLQRMLAELPAGLGVVLSTRDSGLAAARKLGLAPVTMATPDKLGTVMHRLLQHVADTHQVDEADRERWVELRRSWLDAARQAHPDIADVPLLATIMTLVVAKSATIPVTHGPAKLLRTAVQQSVQDWEHQRRESVGTRPGQPTAQQLLDGFTAIGSRLMDSESASQAQVRQAIAVMLADEWDIRAAGPADELTRHILQFWDQHMGVFVDAGDGAVRPRSRVFAEIAAAMAVRWLADEPLREWVDTAVGNPDRGVTLTLAAELHANVLNILLRDEREPGFATRALLAADVLRHAADTSYHELHVVVTLLTDAAEEYRDLDPDVAVSGWRCMVALAELSLPTALRTKREQALERLCADDQQRVIVTALVALSDAATDGTALCPSQVASVRAALQLPGPARRISDEVTDVDLDLDAFEQSLPGHLQVAVASIPHLKILGSDMVNRVHALIGLASVKIYSGLVQALEDAGYDVPMPVWRKTSNALVAYALPGISWEKRQMPLLESAARIAEPSPELSVQQRWRLSELASLFSLLYLPKVTLGDLRATFAPGQDKTRTGWLRALTVAAGLDLALVAAQARAAIAELHTAAAPQVADFLEAPVAGPIPAWDSSRLGERERSALLAAITSDSGWMAQSAKRILKKAANVADCKPMHLDKIQESSND
ncbi:NACHT domain-containing NTPase [Micromonospora sp. CNB394]|uniref:NACHT domain-containing protein n=1 Tax=Micromonospora sp. CNB394 TaxID=1169151 RepID=UPI0003797916|nr:NACHT domain-containing protein [Micromonospora sp. CNB394]